MLSIMEVSTFISRLFLMTALVSTSAHGQFEDLDFDEFDSDLPVVLTAVRLKQLQSDVPASVTVLRGQTLVDMGIKDLSEAFRLVPGMMVGYDVNNKVSVVHYHGGPASLPRNLQVLLDGRSVYHASVAAVDWQNIPVAIEDIDRIEVVRGPNASSYGSNAFQAIINILTKHSADVEGSEVSRKQGNNGVQESYARIRKRLANTDMRFTAQLKHDNGIDRKFTDNSYESAFVDSQINHRLFDGSDLTFTGIYQKTDKPLVSIDGAGGLTFSDKEKESERTEFSVRWEKSFGSNHKLKVSSFGFRSAHDSSSDVGGDELYNILLDPTMRDLYLSNPQAVNALVDPKKPFDIGSLTQEEQLSLHDLMIRYGITDLNDSDLLGNLDTFHGTIDNSLVENRFDIEIQDTFIVGDHFTLISGAGFRRDVTESEAFFGGYASNNTTRIFSSMDWDSLDRWKAHIGLMWEKESELEAVFNPRAALTYRLGLNHSLRAVASRSVRSPDMFETQTKWQYRLSDIESDGPVYGDTFYQIAVADEDLSHERIISKELGYYYLSLDNRIELDVRAFHEELTDMLDQSLAIDNWYNENKISMYFRGIEYQVAYKPYSMTQLRMTAAYIDAGSSENEATLLRVYAENSGSLSWVQRWPSNIVTAMAYYLADSYNSKEDQEDISTFERFDFRIAKTFALDSRYDLETSAYFQKDLKGEGLVFDNVKYKDSLRYIFSASLKF